MSGGYLRYAYLYYTQGYNQRYSEQTDISFPVTSAISVISVVTDLAG
jgi:hypothetical protein